MPFPEQLLDRTPESTVIHDSTGAVLRVRLAENDLDCRPVYEGDFNHWICKALIAVEDQRFMRHCGLDFVALVRASGQNFSAGRTISGASTLSTQLIRMASPPAKRKLPAKIREAFRALQMERRHSKDEIITHYLNRAPFGTNILGIEAASRRYFGKEASSLSLAEAALLAGVPQSPSRLRPDRYPARAIKRQHHVLDRMLDCGFISSHQFSQAMAETLDIRLPTYSFSAPHFCDALLARGHSGQIFSTLDPELQALAESAIEKQGAALRSAKVYGGAAVILEIKTGAVRALVGSPDFHDRQHAGQVNCALAPRSPGSTLKPFVYALGLDRGLLTPERKLADIPRRFGSYAPVNFDSTFSGLVSVRHALVQSLNIPALDVSDRLGVDTLYCTLQQLGISNLTKPPESYGLGLALGNAEMRLLELANAYACLARGGIYAPYHFLNAPEESTQPRIFSEPACWMISEMLSGDERAMQATGHAADVRLPRLAWKTGTSSGFRDAWTIGYNPDYVVAVWLGNPDGQRSERLVGIEAAAPVVWEIVRQLYPRQESPWFIKPEGIIERSICSRSGQPAGIHCPETEVDCFIENTTRLTACQVHAEGSTKEAWPAEVAHFIRSESAPTKLKISTPTAGSCYTLIDQKHGYQKIALHAVGGRLGKPLFWFIDQAYLGSAISGQPLHWPLARGEHTISCCTENGQVASTRITVE